MPEAVWFHFSSQVSVEPIERSAPQFSIRRQPLVDLHERLETQSVEPPLGVRADLDEPRVAKDPQVLRDGGLAEAQVVDEDADGPLAAPEQVEDVAARRLGEDSEAHPSSIPVGAYTCQGMKADAPPAPAVASRLCGR